MGLDSGEAIDLSELRFRFDIRRGDRQTPNSANIRVYNVGPQIAQRVQLEFTRVVVQAGYDGNYGIIFDGQIKQIRRGRESQTDTYLDITAADGDSAYNYSVTSRSLAAGANTPNDAVSAILRDMARHGIQQGYIPDLPGDPLPRGKVLYGMSRDIMRQIADTTATSWSIQDGKLVMIPQTAYMPGDIPELTYETGVIGLPEQTQNGISLKILLNPNIKIGQAVKLDNEAIQRYQFSLSRGGQLENEQVAPLNKLNNDGLYYVMNVEYQGDTRGDEWFSNLTCLAIDATVTPIFEPTFPLGYNYINSIKRYG
ncbi:MAG TPA: hypothetical protein VIK69_12055 [Methylophilaceae bacterium]